MAARGFVGQNAATMRVAGILLLSAAFGPRARELLGAASGPRARELLGAAFGPPALLVLIVVCVGCRSAPHATTQPLPSTAPVASSSVASSPAVSSAAGPARSFDRATIPPASSGRAARVKRPRPQTKDACAACRGLWAVHGISEVESCICGTSDGGRSCRDGAECEGQCIADDGKFEIVERGPPPRGFYVGRCSEYDTTFGCYRIIPHGARGRGPLPSDDAAEHICVD